MTIRRPVDEVFRFVADGDNAARWRPGVIDIARVSGDGTGAVYRQGVRGPGGRRVAADYQISVYEPGERLAFRAIAGPVRPIGEFRFRPEGDQTTVVFSLEASLSGWKKLVMGRMVQSTMDSEVRSLDVLKKILES